jgi:protein-L-isoaspartate(D-aspartate) O-methyltransferase
MNGIAERRVEMVRSQLRARGVSDPAVLEAMARIPREAFVDPGLLEFAYEDAPLPILEGQTISQPYIVAAMTEALNLQPDDRVLDVGTGSGYAAAVLSRIVREVYTIERYAGLAKAARAVFERLGYDNIHLRVGDGTLGWPGEAPFDAIMVAAGGPGVPKALLDQLALGGRLVIPVGDTPREQELVRLEKDPEGKLRQERLGHVRFVPLVGDQGWQEDVDEAPPERSGRRWSLPTRPAYPAGERRAPARTTSELIGSAAEPFDEIETVDHEPLLARAVDARVILLGEASHGTSEFYRMRSAITQALIERAGVRIVAIEGDWPDVAHLDAWVRHRPVPETGGHTAFARFPTWMWLNREVRDFLAWLRGYNDGRPEQDRVSIHGLDLYSLYGSIEAVLRYLDQVDPESAAVARVRYGCLSPWESDAATYGRAVLTGRYHACEQEATETLQDLLARRLEYIGADGDSFLDAVQNARVVRDAERYYRVMYYGSRESWNLRDQHMFDTLLALLEHRGRGSRAAVWAHNSHLGDASATEMGVRGEHNVGQLAREHFGAAAYLVGFGTHAGTVAAAHDWDGEMEVMSVRPSHERSYERLCHDAGLPRFRLPLRAPQDAEVKERLMEEHLERAIGVIYRPSTELMSHYFHATLPRQFDEYVWFDQTTAVAPLRRAPTEVGMPDTFPFGL